MRTTIGVCPRKRRRVKLLENVKVPTMASNAPTVFDLNPSEKLQLVEDLWDDLALTPDAVPVHPWQKKELDRRKANLKMNRATGLDWEEVKRRVRRRHGR